MKSLLLFSSFLSAYAIEYPHYTKTLWQSNSMTPRKSQGWKLTGEVNLQLQFESAAPDLQIVTRLQRTTREQPQWTQNGFY